MKVKDAIEYLKEYNPQDKILMMWWDADSLPIAYTYPDDIVSNEEWDKIIDITDGYGFDDVNNDVYDILQETLFDIRKGNNNESR